MKMDCKIAMGVCALGALVCLWTLVVWIYKTPEEMLRQQRDYVDEDGAIRLGRDGSTITSPLFQLDDGTTLAEAGQGWDTVDPNGIKTTECALDIAITPCAPVKGEPSPWKWENRFK